MSTEKPPMPDAFVVPVDPDAPATSLEGLNVTSLWKNARAEPKQGTTRTLWAAHNGVPVTCVSLGKEADWKTNRAEAVRRAVATGIKSAQGFRAKLVDVDVSGDPHAAGTQKSSMIPLISILHAVQRKVPS